jgi:polyribonucleotide nucleotidyltransferase
MFPENFKNEVQIFSTVMSSDKTQNPDIAAMIGASAALTISGAPFDGPMGAARVGFIDGEYILNPSFEQLEESYLDMVVAGTDEAVLMVESEAKELNEDLMLGAVLFGHQEMKAVINACNELKTLAGKEMWVLEVDESASNYYSEVESNYKDQITEAFKISIKSDRNEALAVIKNQIVAEYEESDEFELSKILDSFKELEKNIVQATFLIICQE